MLRKLIVIIFILIDIMLSLNTKSSEVLYLFIQRILSTH